MTAPEVFEVVCNSVLLVVLVFVDCHDVREVSVVQRVRCAVVLETPELAGHLQQLFKRCRLGYLEVGFFVLAFIVLFSRRKLLDDGDGHLDSDAVAVDPVTRLLNYWNQLVEFLFNLFFDFFGVRSVLLIVRLGGVLVMLVLRFRVIGSLGIILFFAATLILIIAGMARREIVKRVLGFA